MKTKLHLLLIAIFFGFGLNAQTVSITGSGTGGWNQPGGVILTDMGGGLYAKAGVEILGSGGGSSEIKFSEGTWGTTGGYDKGPDPINNPLPGWPNGTVVLNGGSNIPAVPGFWDVTYNSTTKAYTFVAGQNPNREVRISGGGLASPIRLSSPDGISFSKESVTFATGGDAQFIETPSAVNATPTANWSNNVFPASIGTQDGPLIPVAPGVYYLIFDAATGSYAFDTTTVSIIGGGFTETDMNTADGVTYTLNFVFASAGSFKFRDNHSWNFNFGTDLANPGIAVQDNCCEVEIPHGAGAYDITFNRLTLAYSLVGLNANINFNSANATPSTSAMGSPDGVDYSANSIVFGAGGAGSFDEVASVLNPSGPFGTWPVATTPVSARRNVLFNKNTGVYSFPFVTMSMTGVNNNWGADLDFTTADGVSYTYAGLVISTAEASQNGLKIRENHSWSYGEFGGAGASGTAIPGTGNNIILPVGTYNVTFDRNTLAYSFTNALAVNKLDANKFSVYPNPTTNSWNFTSGNSDITSVRIVDMLGKTVMSKNSAAKEVSVDASSLSKGMYFATITSGDSVQTVKVIRD